MSLGPYTPGMFVLHPSASTSPPALIWLGAGLSMACPSLPHFEHLQKTPHGPPERPNGAPHVRRWPRALAALLIWRLIVFSFIFVFLFVCFRPAFVWRSILRTGLGCAGFERHLLFSCGLGRRIIGGLLHQPLCGYLLTPHCGQAKKRACFLGAFIG